MPRLDPDFDAASAFLEALDPTATRWSFQTFPEGAAADPKKLTRVIQGPWAHHKAELGRLNHLGAAVCVVMNETDFQGTSRENILRVRAVTLDLDRGPVDAVMACGLKPHLLIQTSPGRYHAYWLTKDFTLEAFAGVQRAIAKRFDGDPAVALLTHRARIPGYFHRKGEPFLVNLISNEDHPPYDAATVLKEFPPLSKPHKRSQSKREEAGTKRPDGPDDLILPNGAPLVAAEQYVLRHYTLGDVRLLLHYRGSFYRWTGSHYAELADEVLEAALYGFLSKAFVETKNGDVSDFKPTKGKINEIVHALKRSVLADASLETPCWIGSNKDRSAQDLVACRNGLLNLRTRDLLPHNPTFLSMTCLPLDFNPDEPEPAQWLKFLNQLWPDDPDAILCLQTIFGYLISTDTRHQKLFLIVGPKRAGKGTITFVLNELLGDKNVVYSSLRSLAGEFGRWPLIDKTLLVVPDARLGSRAEGGQTLTEILLSLSGGDPQSVNRKNQPFWTGRLGVRILITSNELPGITDASGTLPSRYILLKLTKSFFGHEDLDLKAKLAPELGGILRWSLVGRDNLLAHGSFVMPQSSLESIRQMEDSASPVSSFIRDWCQQEPEDRIKVKALYAAFRCWSQEAGQRPILATHMFGKALHAVIPDLKMTASGANRSYLGIDLSDAGEEMYRKSREAQKPS